ncbi:hypothetical protein GQ54DRAFT_294951 [Martensiomyces pterosporus]|nr:hypothetical protein GQ54DRAFT_294951 [Martensiomyces pterosporus]
MHESGVKHKENVQRYLRRVDKEAEAKESAEAKLRSQLESIERAAALSYTKDVGGEVESSSAASSAAAATGKAAPSVIDKKKDEAQMNGAVLRLDPAEEQGAAGSSMSTGSLRPADAGIVGAWEVVEEACPGGSDQDQAGSSISKPPATEGSSENAVANLRGAEWIDEEDSPSQALEEFDIAEKTVAAPQASAAAAASTEIAGLFKKRRTASNRNARNQRRKV